MADELPSYDPKVSFDVTPGTDISRSVQYMINGFKEFSNQANSVINRESNQIEAQDKQNLQYNISKTYQDFANQALVEPDKNKALSDYQAKAQEYSNGLKQSAGNQGDLVNNLTSYYGDQHYNTLLRAALFQNKRMDFVNNVTQLDQLNKDMIEAAKNPNTMAPAGPQDEPDDPQFVSQKNQINDDLSSGKINQDQHDQQMGNLLHQYGNQEPTQQFAAAQSIAASQKALIHKMVFNGEMEPETSVRAIDRIDQQLKGEQLHTEYRKAVDNGTGADFIQHVIEHSPFGWTAQQTHAMVAGWLSEDMQLAKARGLNTTVVNGQVAANIQNIEENGAIPNETVRQNVALLHPEAVGQYDQNVKDAMTVHSYRQAWLSGDPKQIAQMQSLMKVDPNDPDALHQIQLNNKINKSLSQLRTNWNRDPMPFEQQQPYFQMYAQHAQSAQDAGAGGQNLTNTPVNSQIKVPDVYQQVIASQQLKGKQLFGTSAQRIKLLTNQEALNNVSFVNNPATSADQISKFYADLRSKFSNNTEYQLALKQMGDLGLNPRMQFASTLADDTPNRDQLIQALKTPTSVLESGLDKSNVGILKAGVNNDIFQRGNAGTTAASNAGDATPQFNSFLQTLHPANGVYDQGYLQNMYGTVYALGLHYMQSGQATSASQAKQMAENTFANRYDYKTVSGGATVAIPKNGQMAPDVAQQFINQQSNNIKNVQFGNMGTLPSAQAQQRENINAGHFINTDDDNTLVWVGANGKIPPLPNGQPYTIDLQHAVRGNTNVGNPDLKIAVNNQLSQNYDPKTTQALKSVAHPSFHPYFDQQAQAKSNMTGTEKDIQAFNQFKQDNSKNVGGAP